MSDAERQQVLEKAELTGKSHGMRDASDVRTFIDVDALKVGDDGAITGLDAQLQALKKSKPYLFFTFDHQNVHEQLEKIGVAQQDDAIKNFVASKPSNDDLLRAINTGDFRC